MVKNNTVTQLSLSQTAVEKKATARDKQKETPCRAQNTYSLPHVHPTPRAPVISFLELHVTVDKYPKSNFSLFLLSWEAAPTKGLSILSALIVNN